MDIRFGGTPRYRHIGDYTLIKAIVAGAAVLAWALPAGAQERGTMEFGAFGSAASFDRALSLTTAYGGGGRIGMFLDPRWSLEFENAEMRAGRPNGLRDVNVGLLSGRLVAVPLKSGALSLLLGAGAGVSTETNFMHSYGVDALLGAKIAVSRNAAIRVDGVFDWLANENWKTYRSVRVGLSLYRRPGGATRTVMAAALPSTPLSHSDSVSAAETRRLRDRDAALRALRDSLSTASSAPSPAAVATMQARVHFDFDKSELVDSSRAILDEKARVFRANPDMTVVMRGFTDTSGTDAYNMALGLRRAQAVKSYLVAQGIDANRISIESAGEREQIGNSGSVSGQAANRRAVFEVLMTPDAHKQ